MNRLLFIIAAAVLCTGVLVGCNKTNENNNDQTISGDTILPGTDKTIDEILAETDGPVYPTGEVTEIWFEEAFNAFYPKQLKDIIFTKMYMYGQLQSDQPVICLCSQTLSEVEVFDMADGKTLYEIESLVPMEALVLQVELEEQPVYGVRFTDESGKRHEYSIAKNSDSSEVIVKSIEG